MGLFDLLKKKVAEPKQSVSPTQKKPILASTGLHAPTEDEIPSLESRIKGAFPSKNGLYPHEILMLDYASSYKTSKNTFQGFWKWNYSVLNPQKVLDSLLARGFICRGDASSSLKHLLVSDLKQMLIEVGVKPTGKKEDLILQILATYSVKELDATFPDRHYVLTELGEAELRENEYVSYLHRHDYMSAWDMNILLNQNNPSKLGYRDVLWREFNKQSGEYFRKCNFGLFRNTRLNMYKFLTEEKKHKAAFYHLAEVISFDLSGLGNGTKPLAKGLDYHTQDSWVQHRLVNFFRSQDEKDVSIPGGVVKFFEKTYKELNMSPDDFIAFTYEQFAKIRIHERVFTESECANFILSEIGLEPRKIQDSYSVATKRLRKMFTTPLTY